MINAVIDSTMLLRITVGDNQKGASWGKGGVGCRFGRGVLRSESFLNSRTDEQGTDEME